MWRRRSPCWHRTRDACLAADKRGPRCRKFTSRCRPPWESRISIAGLRPSCAFRIARPTVQCARSFRMPGGERAAAVCDTRLQAHRQLLRCVPRLDRVTDRTQLTPQAPCWLQSSPYPSKQSPRSRRQTGHGNVPVIASWLNVTAFEWSLRAPLLLCANSHELRRDREGWRRGRTSATRRRASRGPRERQEPLQGEKGSRPAKIVRLLLRFRFDRNHLQR